MPELSAGIGRSCAELLDRVERDSEHTGKRSPILLIIHIHTVQRHVALVRLSAIHRTVPRIIEFRRICLA